MNNKLREYFKLLRLLDRAFTSAIIAANDTRCCYELMRVSPLLDGIGETELERLQEARRHIDAAAKMLDELYKPGAGYTCLDEGCGKRQTCADCGEQEKETE